MMSAKISALLFLLLWYGAASFAAEAKPDWRAEWEKTVAAAEKESIVSIYIFENGPLTEETVRAFERAYPKIKVSQLRGRGNDLGPRLLAERRADKRIADLFAGGKGTAFSTLYVGKLLEPIKPILLLPEVLDESRWWRGKHKYVDPENKYIFVYIGNAGGVEINYNSKLVNPREFSSYWDLVQPKWKGKDRRRGSAPARHGQSRVVLLLPCQAGARIYQKALRRNGSVDYTGLPSAHRLARDRKVFTLYSVRLR
jgi:ABC-type Fe3+ transport system substrate-binding protein